MHALPLAVDVPVPANRYVPTGFDASDIEAVRQLARALLERPIDSPAELAVWIDAWGELWSAVDDAGTRRRIASDRDTRDEAARSEFARFQRDVDTPWQELDDALNRRFLDSPHLDELDDYYGVLVRDRRETAALFRAENLARREREEELHSSWSRIQGALAVELDGRSLTSSQAEAVGYSRDRKQREAAYRALALRRAADRDEIDGLLDQLVTLRHELARCAGSADYVQHRFRELHRFDYTPADCDAFARAIELHVVPLLRELRASRAVALGIDSVRPWDQRVNVHSADDTPLFASEEEFAELGTRLIRRVSPELGAQLDMLRRNGLLDLFARPGKAPGGYCASLPGVRLPFLFVNAVGTPRDVIVLLHEAGHGLHAIASRERDPAAYRETPAEFAEVASMSMELLGMQAFPDVLPAERARAMALEELEDVVSGLCRTALVDSFQRWMYTHPSHSRAERRSAWVEASARFTPDIDWTGLEDVLANDWQRIPHLFGWPLYYVEYGIAQLGALQVWRNARRDPTRALDAYRHALSLGGSRPLPELFAAAGARFGLDEPLVAELAGELRAALRELEGARAT